MENNGQLRFVKSFYTTTKTTNTMEIVERIKELERRGYKCVRPLIDNLPYTDGVTRTFDKQYFTCYDEKDPERKLVIFNSKLEKLGATGSDRVTLRIKEATATRSSLYPTTEPSAWCVEKAEIDMMNRYANFNTIKLRAALDAVDSGIEVAECCGIVPVFPHPVPSSFVSHWAVETKTMRDTLVAAIKTALEERQRLLGENWELVKYIDENGIVITFELYEMCEFTGAIRHVHTKQIIKKSSRLRLCIAINGKTTRKTIKPSRAYMSTFRMGEKRTHQDFVDHIDGDDSNNVPWNYRWVSTSENGLVKHSGRARYTVPDIDALTAKYGEPSGPKKLEGWTIYDNMWIIRPNESYEKRYVTYIVPGHKYPRIGVTFKDSDNESKSRNILCHKLVAFVHRATIAVSDKTKEYLKSVNLPASYFAESPMADDVAFSDALTAGGLVIMHFPDNDVSNYRVSNLMIGTYSENGIDRQDNPATTSRKSVKIIDTVSKKCIWIFGSYTEAAAFLGVTVSAVWRAATFNGTRKIEEYRKTKSKKTGAKYYIVDA
jgi:hypothetical protein